MIFHARLPLDIINLDDQVIGQTTLIWFIASEEEKKII